MISIFYKVHLGFKLCSKYCAAFSEDCSKIRRKRENFLTVIWFVFSDCFQSKWNTRERATVAPNSENIKRVDRARCCLFSSTIP